MSEPTEDSQERQRQSDKAGGTEGESPPGLEHGSEGGEANSKDAPTPGASPSDANPLPTDSSVDPRATGQGDLNDGPDPSPTSDEKPSPETESPKPENKYEITPAMRKSFIASRLGVTDAPDAGAKKTDRSNHISVMINMFTLLGMGREAIESVIEGMRSVAALGDETKRQAGADAFADNVCSYLANVAGGSDKLKKQLDEYSNYITANMREAVAFFRHFRDVTGVKDGPDLDVLNCISNIEMYRDSYPSDCDRRLMDELISSVHRNSERSILLNKSAEMAREATKEVQLQNMGVVDRNFEMAEDTMAVGAAAMATIFPPALIFAAIAYILYTKDKENLRGGGSGYIVNAVSFIEDKRRKGIEEIESKLQGATEKRTKDVIARAFKKREEVVEELKKSIPDSMKPFLGNLVSPMANRVTGAIIKLNEEEKREREEKERKNSHREEEDRNRVGRENRKIKGEKKNDGKRAKGEERELKNLRRCSSEISSTLLKTDRTKTPQK